MNGWIVVGLIVAVYYAVIAMLFIVARHGPLVDAEPISQRSEPQPPERYVRLVPRDLFVLALGVLLAACASAEAAQKPCGPHNHITGQLDDRYREEIRSLGLQSDGHLIQVYVAANGATWTIVSTRPDGMACIVAAGKWWQDLPRDVPIGMAR